MPQNKKKRAVSSLRRLLFQYKLYQLEYYFFTTDAFQVWLLLRLSVISYVPSSAHLKFGALFSLRLSSEPPRLKSHLLLARNLYSLPPTRATSPFPNETTGVSKWSFSVPSARSSVADNSERSDFHRLPSHFVCVDFEVVDTTLVKFQVFGSWVSAQQVGFCADTVGSAAFVPVGLCREFEFKCLVASL